MFKFIKKMFEKEAEKAELDIDGLTEWFNQKTKEFSTTLDLKTDFLELKEFLDKLKQDLSNLENAEMKDEEKIQSKIKSVVLGHRKSYITVLRNFAESIDIPENTTYMYGLKISTDIQERLDDIGKTTIKSYYAVQHLFSNQLEAVANDLKQLSKLSHIIKDKIEKSKLAAIDQAKEDIESLIYSIKVKKEMAVQLREKGKDLLKLNNIKIELKDRLKEVKEGKSFSELEELKKEKQDIEYSIKQKENEILEIFSPLDAALKKYQRIAIDNWDLIEKYAGSAVNALLSDRELKIIIILDSMRQNIIKEVLELKDEKKSRALKAIESITHEKLKQIVDEYNNFTKKKEETENQIKLNAAKSTITEIEYKLEHLLFKIQKLNDEIEIHKKKYDKIDLDSLKKELEDNIKEITEVELKINL